MKGFRLDISEQSQSENRKKKKDCNFRCLLNRQSQANFTVCYVFLVPSHLLPLGLQRKSLSLDLFQKMHVPQVCFLRIKHYLALNQILLHAVFCLEKTLLYCWLLMPSAFIVSVMGTQLRTTPSHNDC